MTAITDLCTTPAGVSAERKYAQLLANLAALDKSVDPTTASAAETEALVAWIAEVLLPNEALLPPEHVLEDDDDVPPPPPPVLGTYQDVCRLALQLLARLSPPPAMSTPLAIALISQTDASDTWTTPASRALSAALLSNHAFPASALTALLTALKPHFTLPHPTLTATAHAAHRPSTARAPLLHAESPPFRHAHPYAPTLLHWTTARLPPTHLEAVWPLLAPPLLTLLDDTHAPTKTRGARILAALAAHPQAPHMLARTGLARVFWDAALPCTMALPPLTPTAVSLPLLAAGFDALVALARATAPPGRGRAALLGGVLRRSVVAGMRVAGERAAVAEALLRAMAALAGEMGVWVVRHLGECVGVLVGVLGDPFVGAWPPVAVAAARAVVALASAAWVRVRGYVPALVGALVVCWRRVAEDEGRVRGGEEVVGEVRRAVGVLGAVVERAEWAVLVRAVVGAEGRAAGLFVGLE